MDPIVYRPKETTSATCKNGNCKGGGKSYLNKLIAAPSPNERVHLEYHLYCTACQKRSFSYRTVTKRAWENEKLFYIEEKLAAPEADKTPCPRTGNLFDE